MSVYLRGRIYHYEFQYQGQPYRGSTFQTDKREAEKVERAKRQAVLNGERNVAGHSVKDIFASYYEAYGKKLKWAPTLGKHMDGLEASFGANTRFVDITTKDVAKALEDYAAQTTRVNRGGKTIREGSPSDSTVNRRLAVFRQIYNTVREAWELPVGLVNFKTLTRDEPEERVRHITEKEAKTVLRLLGDDLHIALMVAWSLVTGCRLNETETLRWSRVNYELMQVEVDAKGKKKKTRFVDLNPDAIAVLAQCDRNRVYVFDSTNRRKIWEAAVEAAGLEDFHWHDLRHTFATWLGNRTGDIALVMKALGHGDIGTTMKYRHVIRADVKAGVAKLPTLIEGKVVSLTAQSDEAAGA